MDRDTRIGLDNDLCRTLFHLVTGVNFYCIALFQPPHSLFTPLLLSRTDFFSPTSYPFDRLTLPVRSPPAHATRRRDLPLLYRPPADPISATSTTASTPGPESASGGGLEDGCRQGGSRGTPARKSPQRLAGKMCEVVTEFAQILFAQHLTLLLSGRRAMPGAFYSVCFYFAGGASCPVNPLPVDVDARTQTIPRSATSTG